MIGDNLTSHISLNIASLCKESNSCFICLPPNSSYLSLLLDIAYFIPLKNEVDGTSEPAKKLTLEKLSKDMFHKISFKTIY